jgi:hypothetical protein
MKLPFLALTLVGAGALAFSSTAASLGADSVKVGDPAPDVGGEWLQSSAESLGELRGRVVLIEFWRTW